MSDQSPPVPQGQSQQLWRIGCAICFCLFILLTVWLGFAFRDAREAARRARCKGRLKQLTLALHNYHETYGSFPPAYLADAEGKPMHSWRALILPFADQLRAWQKYDFSQPWNSPQNLAVEDLMHGQILECDSAQAEREGHFADYVVLVGPGTAFPGAQSASLSQMRDGPENTLLIVEIANSDIRWLEPRDLRVDEMSFVLNDPDRPSISSLHPQGVQVAFADGSVRLLGRPFPHGALQALSTISGAERVDKNWFFPVPK